MCGATHQGRGSQQYDDSRPVVESEDVVVNAGRVPFVEQSRDSTEHQGKHAVASAIISLSH